MGVIRWLGSLLAPLLSLVLFLMMPWRWFRRRRPEAPGGHPGGAPPGMEPDLEPGGEPGAEAEAEERRWPQMPRSGKPGTATDGQVEALMEARVLPAPPCRDLHDYSTEEAAAILDAIAFARAVATQVTGGEDADAPPDILTDLLNDLVATTLAEDELRDFAQRWVRSGQPLPIRENTTFARAREAVHRHWHPADTAA